MTNLIDGDHGQLAGEFYLPLAWDRSSDIEHGQGFLSTVFPAPEPVDQLDLASPWLAYPSLQQFISSQVDRHSMGMLVDDAPPFLEYEYRHPSPDYLDFLGEAFLETPANLAYPPFPFSPELLLSHYRGEEEHESGEDSAPRQQ